MRTERDLLILSLAPAGLALGCGVWLLASLFAPPPAELTEVAARLSVPVGQRLTAVRRPGGMAVVGLLSNPLFPPPSGHGQPGALRLEGVSLSGSRHAALIQAGEAPARWVQLGDAIGGATLERVAATSITLEGLDGERTLTLGRAAAEESSSASPSSSSLVRVTDGSSLGATRP